MGTDQPVIAYTIITKRTDGKLMFLVDEMNKEYTFPSANYEESCTALASVINKIKKKLVIEIKQLELSELINTVIDNKRIPLFVFSYDNLEVALEEIITDESSLSWQVSDNFTETLKKYEISGVPYFD